MLVHALLDVARLVAEATPPPEPATTADTGTSGLTTLIPYVTGAGGALVVLLIVIWMFATDKITTVGAVARLREADNNRFNDMVAQRDSLVKALELANATSATATKSATQSLALLRDMVPQRSGQVGGGDE